MNISSNSITNVGLKKYLLIEVPGIVKNIDNAIKMFGGIEKLKNCYFNEQSLNFLPEPDNPLEKGTIGERKDLQSIENLYLIIKLKRHKISNEYKLEILGEASVSYTFKMMTDFMVAPIENVKNSKDIPKDIVNRLFPETLRDSYNWMENINNSGEIFLPPFTFSRYGLPSQRMLCRELEENEYFKFVSKKGHGTNLRAERKALSICVQGNDQFPLAPTDIAIEEANMRCKNPEILAKFKELFEERPVWTRGAIMIKTGFDDRTLKFILPKFAFYIINGPFSRLWCKFGYDPRKDKGSFKYQTFMLTLRRFVKIPQKMQTKSNVLERFSRADTSNLEEESPEHFYKEGILPKSRQIWYSFCDILLPSVQESLNNIKLHPFVKYDRQFGWIPSSFVIFTRKEVRKDIAKIVSTMEAEDIEVMDDDDWNSD
ncbi:General transcription factor 3C polypeptide 5 [Strongyloides ratti]|uniref:General transcription factor 3C polypeptide 5 n=1 Tax=Strongyloides ratti TaxID=34506 RepID=A0A090MXE9_STRRB|nr:General transcription factor 3C polypeptide 5 [Strongyloides ratti]CEF65314.1 General transcription factor 3C polypeptide 5 [Strongyloides ratti]